MHQSVDGFKKTIKQNEAIRILSCHKYSALLGGSRSGKTFIIIYAIIVRACKAKSRHGIIRRTFNAVKRSIWNDTLPKVLSICFPNLPYKKNNTDYFIELPNGSQIFLMGLDDNKRVEKILGMEFSTIYFNECSEIDYYPIQVAISRLAEKNSLNKRVYFDFNPSFKTHWSYWLFIKKQSPATNEPLKRPKDYGHLLMNPVDNLDNIDPEYLEILEAMPEKERLRFLEGQFADSGEGLAYYEFKREEHVKRIERIPGHSILIGMDFNIHPSTAVVGHHVNNCFYIFDEVFLENAGTEKVCKDLKGKGYSNGRVFPDSTGANRKTTGLTDFEMLKQYGFIIEKTRNPFVKDRVNNLNRLFKAGKIVIDPRCKNLINDLEKVSWLDNKLNQKTDPMLTHSSDCLAYLTWALDNGVSFSLPKGFKFNQSR